MKQTSVQKKRVLNPKPIVAIPSCPALMLNYTKQGTPTQSHKS